MRKSNFFVKFCVHSLTRIDSMQKLNLPSMVAFCSVHAVSIDRVHAAC